MIGDDNRKYFIALYFGSMCFLLCIVNKISGGECITGISVLAGMYKMTNAYCKKYPEPCGPLGQPDDPDA